MCEVKVSVNKIYFTIGILITALFYQEALCYEYAELHQGGVHMFVFYCVLSFGYFDMGDTQRIQGVITPVMARLSLPGRLILGLTTSRIPTLTLPSKSVPSAAI